MEYPIYAVINGQKKEWTREELMDLVIEEVIRSGRVGVRYLSWKDRESENDDLSQALSKAERELREKDEALEPFKFYAEALAALHRSETDVP